MMVKFSTLTLNEHGELVETDIREIAQENIMKCPHVILTPEHYREDGSCRCDDPTHTEMKKWGYKWKGTTW